MESNGNMANDTGSPGSRQSIRRGNRKRKASVVLTAKRRQLIVDFKSMVQEESQGKNTTASEPGTDIWKYRLIDFLRRQDDKITHDVVGRWIKAHSWITEKQNQRDSLVSSPHGTTRSRSPSPPVLSRATSPAVGPVPASSSMLATSPSEPSTLEFRLNDPPSVPQPSRRLSFTTLPIPGTFQPPPPPLPPYQSRPFFYHHFGDGSFPPMDQSAHGGQPVDAEEQMKKVYDDVFNSIRGMGKHFRSVPELRSMLIYLNKISKGVARSHHHFISPPHNEVFQAYIRGQQMNLKQEHPRTAPDVSYPNREDDLDVSDDVISILGDIEHGNDEIWLNDQQAL